MYIHPENVFITVTFFPTKRLRGKKRKMCLPFSIPKLFRLFRLGIFFGFSAVVGLETLLANMRTVLNPVQKRYV